MTVLFHVELYAQATEQNTDQLHKHSVLSVSYEPTPKKPTFQFEISETQKIV